MSRVLLLLGLVAGCAPADEAVEIAVRDCRLHVAFPYEGLPAAIGVAGDFNGDDPAKAPLRRDADGVWRGAVEVPPGRHLYRVMVDGRAHLDAANPVTVRHLGVEYSVFEAPDCARPAFERLAVEHHRDAPRLTFRLQRVDPATGLDADSVVARAGDHRYTPAVEGDRVTLALTGPPPGKHQLRLEARDAAGRAVEPVEGPFWVEAERFRWEDALIYQVVVDRFAGDAPFTPVDRLKPPGARHGGNLRGLRAKLEEGYFDRLGVNVLWISPLNLNPEGAWTGVEGGPPRYESYHGYWPMAPRGVDPRFGTEADVEALVAAAHARGVRVLMDVVLNHVHQSHPYFEARPGWFNRPACQCGTPACPWWSHIETCWFTGYLPDLRWDHVDTLETQVSDAVWWMERFDLDGLRVDAVPMMPRFVTRNLTARVHRRFEALHTRHYLLGETFTDPEGHGIIRWYLGPQGLDGQFDFPVMWALRQAFAWESAPLWSLADAWRRSEAAWAGSAAVMALFVGNHDVTRFLSEAAGQLPASPWEAPPPIPDDPLPYDRLLLAQTFVLTAPGAPVLYQGDEHGMPGAGDPDNRRPMRFGGERTSLEKALHGRTERLGRLRRCLPALRRGALRFLREEAERLVFLRDAGDGAPAIVVLNRTPADAAVTIPLPPDAPGGAYVDALSGRRLLRDDRGLEKVALAPRTPLVLLPEGHACLEEAER